jgi:hypothetical protein
MLFFLFRGRYGPLLRAAAGIAVIVFGVIASTPFLVMIGGLLLAWGAVAGVGQLTGRRRNSGAAGPRGGGLGPRR